MSVPLNSLSSRSINLIPRNFWPSHRGFSGVFSSNSASSAACPKQPVRYFTISLVFLPPIQHFQMMYVHQWYKIHFFSLRPRFIDHLFCYFWLSSNSTPKFSNFSHSLSTASFAAWIFQRLRQKNQSICDTIVMLYLIVSFPAICLHDDLVSGILVDSSHASFVSLLLDSPLPQFFFIILQSIAGSTGVSNFLQAFFDGAPKFLVLRVNLDPSQFSCVIQMELLIRPLLLLPQLSVSHCLPDFWS